jgi:hypothetical protein
MMASREEICNEALGLIGEGPIVSIEDIENKAIKCNQFWATTRDACLRVWSWTFATKRVLLAQNAVAPVFGYLYSYKRPSDSLRIIAISDDYTEIDSPILESASIEYKLEGDDILTDSEGPLYAKYIRRIEDTGYFDPLFCGYLAAELAAKLGMGLTKEPSLINSMIQLADMRLREAKDMDLKEGGTPTIRRVSLWKSARG